MRVNKHCEQINNSMISRNVVNDNKMPKWKTFTDQLVIQFNVFVASIKNWIHDHVKSTHIVIV